MLAWRSFDPEFLSNIHPATQATAQSRLLMHISACATLADWPCAHAVTG
jgi:hypothetical protein